MRRASFLLMAMAVALVLGSGAAVAAVKFGTDGTDFLVGTKVDDVYGRSGDDSIDGRWLEHLGLWWATLPSEQEHVRLSNLRVYR